MLASFHSVVIDVRDFESGVDDYARMLGLRPIRIERNAARGSRSALFALGNMGLEIRSGHQPSGAGGGLAGLRLGLAAPAGSEGDDEALAGQLLDRGVPLAEHGREVAESIGGEAPRQWFVARLAASASRDIPLELVVEDPWTEPAVDEESATAIQALDHVVILSADVEATRDFYAGTLGIRLALDRSFEKRGVRLLFFRLGGVTIEIGGRLDAPPASEPRDRFGGLAWQVRDIEAIHARLVAGGFDLSEVRVGHKPGTRVCTVRDPVHEVPTLLIEPVD